MEEFTLERDDRIALHDLLKVMRFCDSGGAAKTAIAEGSVRVDGVVELRKGCKIRSGQRVEFKGHVVIVK